ncbi:MAG: penicillin acylase family protein [Deltaproteobacteria bacterium]
MRRIAAGRRPARILLLALPVASLLLSCSTLFRSSAPVRSGTLSVAGLHSPVEILRDSWGVPHITAQDDHDLYFAQGFVHAQDRLFQMEMERRVARGELAELFGERLLAVDRLFRHLGFSARAPGLVASWPTSSREIVEAYCAGVNAAVSSLRALPAEMRLLDLAVRPFTPEDVAAVGLLKSFGLAQWTDEVALYRASRVLSPEKLAALMPRVPAGSPVLVPDGRGSEGAKGTRVAGIHRDGTVPVLPEILLRGLASLSEAGLSLPRSGGSNAWAVSGRKSETGLPLLAGDPHLLLPCPSLWYENHLVAPGVDVYGVSFPGTPCVVIGHNPDIAWSFTNTMLDDADFFLERIEGDRVRIRKRWVPLSRRVETIRVKGKRDETVTVLETPHGPILSPVLPGVSRALSFRWIGYDGGDLIGAIHRLDRARNREQFLEAVSHYPHPAQNIVYADRFGNIGAVTAGRIPVRKGGSSLLPVPGDTGEWEWTGTVPFRENPQVWNPAGGVIAAANFPAVGPGYPYYLSRLYEPPDRGRRILAVLAKGEKFSVEDFARLQADVLRADIDPWIELALRVARKGEAGSWGMRQAVRLLSAWDRAASADSAGATLFEVFSEKLIENTFRDDLGEELFEEATRNSRLLWNAMDRAVAEGDSPFFEDSATGRKETLDELATRSLVDALARIQHDLGNAPDTWRWGRLHQVSFEHPFGKKRYLRGWFSIGPHPMAGDGRTVMKGEFRHGSDFSVLVGPSMRQIVPLGSRKRARSVLTTGQSGHFFEPHYRDQAPLWLSGKTHPAWTDPADIRDHLQSRLLLKVQGRS